MIKDVPVEVVKWLVGDDAGASSKAIVLNYYGIKSWNYPLDCWDFGRCVRMLQRFPWMGVGHMKTVNGVWTALVDKWPELVNAYYEDVEARKKTNVTDEEIKPYLGKRTSIYSDKGNKVRDQLWKEKLNKLYNGPNGFGTLIDGIRKSVQTEEKKILNENNAAILGNWK